MWPVLLQVTIMVSSPKSTTQFSMRIHGPLRRNSLLETTPAEISLRRKPFTFCLGQVSIILVTIDIYFFTPDETMICISLCWSCPSLFVCLYVESFTLKWATWQVLIVLFVSFNPQDSSKVDFYFLIIIYYTYFFLFPPSIMYSLSWDILPAGIRVFFSGVVLLTQIKGSNDRRFHQLVKAPEAPWLDEFGSMRWMDLRQHTRTGFGLL